MNLEEAAKLSHSDWQQRAAELKKTAETRLFIGGEFVDAIEGGTFENICPVDGSVINICAAGTRVDIEKAVAIAKASFKSGEWSRMAPRSRMAVMGMRKFKSTRQAERFLDTHAAVHNLFNLGRHLVKAEHYRKLRISAFAEWSRAAA